MREDDKSCDWREKSFKVLRKCYIRVSYNSENEDSGFGFLFLVINTVRYSTLKGAQWLRGRVLDSRPRGRGFEPYWRDCIVVLEQDTFILA